MPGKSQESQNPQLAKVRHGREKYSARSITDRTYLLTILAPTHSKDGHLYPLLSIMKAVPAWYRFCFIPKTIQPNE